MLWVFGEGGRGRQSNIFTNYATDGVGNLGGGVSYEVVHACTRIKLAKTKETVSSTRGRWKRETV